VGPLDDRQLRQLRRVAKQWPRWSDDGSAPAFVEIEHGLLLALVDELLDRRARERTN